MMNRTHWIIAAIVGVLSIFVLWNTLFIVSEHNQALVLQFGEPRRVIQEPGLYAKTPFLQNILFFDRRLLDLDLQAEEVPAVDQKRIMVDTFTRYRISNPLLYYETVGSEMNARVRLQNIVTSSLRRVLGRVPLQGLLSDQRTHIMNDIQTQVNTAAKDLGIEIIDVRIRRADLPKENSAAVFERMRTEREREAKDFRARGQEEAQITRVRADREARILKAEAERDAQSIRGSGEKKAILIASKTYSQDRDFYKFYRSLEAYKRALGNEEKTTFLLSTNHPFLETLQKGTRT